ncbi:asparagine synthase (glutamine-hydrolyzing) [Mangrovimonas aestuarii]|uniref:asparagine synthase (glutamine-hydrolyzing) n=1 Tax=Mangrovimonas aestuarii TaxID=3018443 RepID=UPI002379CF86|nr:asparagine synthase (glutamine-hydrolyzing) [Mangrovimonas aestuarii]
MCGIYGTTLKYSPGQVKEKLERTAFRGPDMLDFKFYNNGNHTVTFGHNRLSIVDLDSRSNQPFTYQNGIHIVFNGEVYNFKDLKEELSKKGYSFRTTSDTEVLCAMYMEYGEECVKHLNGMFCFVIFDEKQNKLFGARDRMGQKPMYYLWNKNGFEFSSQLSQIQKFNSDLTISREAISYYFAWGAIPDPISIFNEVKKLKAGYSFTYDISSNSFKTKQYWDIDISGNHLYKGRYSEAVNDLEKLLLDSVQIRLFADVPVGVFLSGGIDSSLVATLATKTTAKKVKTFSVKFNEEGFDESIYAQQVANHLNTDHVVIECNYKEGIDLIENFSYYYDEPFADPSAIPTMLLSKYTRKHVTVALSGDGGDESFIGYQRYDWIKRGQRAYRIPYPLRSALGSIVGLAPNYRLKILANALKFRDINRVYLAGMTGVDLSWIDSEYDYLKADELRYLYHKRKNLFERVSDLDLKTYLNWDINTKVDRASMAYSLEARSPLMDYRVVEFARSLPTEFKYKGKNKKRILKDILYKYVPEHIFDRPKAGFTMPFEVWFKSDLKEFVLDELSLDSLKSIPCIQSEKVAFMIDQHMKSKWNRYLLIWKALVLKQWLKTNGVGYNIE